MKADVLSNPRHYTHVYLPDGTKTHLMQPSHSPNFGDAVLCGLRPLVYQSWFGTGTWDEAQVAQERELCKACLKRISK